MTATWHRAEGTGRGPLLDAAVARLAARRDTAPPLSSSLLERSEIWVRGDLVVWALPTPTAIMLVDIHVSDAEIAQVPRYLGELASDAGWHGEWRIAVVGEDPAMTALVDGVTALRVATKMSIDVAEVPDPVGIALRRMSDDEFAAYRATADEDYAQERFASGTEPTIEEARRVAAAQMLELLPDGSHTAGHGIWTVRDDRGVRVGMLWVSLSEPAGFIYDISMDESKRGRGLGTQTLRAAAAETRRAGLASLRLNVFGSNEGARRLYAREGYREREVEWKATIAAQAR